MYEVFINNKRLVFDVPKAVKKYDHNWHKISAKKYLIKPEKIIKYLKEENTPPHVVILNDDIKKTRQFFFKDFILIKAAGGIVKNNQQKFLFIYRNGKWDLPKGKIEKNELPKAAAIREVKEETGISELILQKKFHITYHIYEIKKQLIIKKTYWFIMSSKSRKKLIPQEEEGITAVKWMDENEVNRALENSYLLIADLFNIYLEQESEYT